MLMSFSTRLAQLANIINMHSFPYKLISRFKTFQSNHPIMKCMLNREALEPNRFIHRKIMIAMKNNNFNTIKSIVVRPHLHNFIIFLKKKVIPLIVLLQGQPWQTWGKLQIPSKNKDFTREQGRSPFTFFLSKNTLWENIMFHNSSLTIPS